jgi:hypothetical protein
MKCYQVAFLRSENGSVELTDINVFHLHEKIYSTNAFIKHKLDKLFGEVHDFNVIKQYEL